MNPLLQTKFDRNLAVSVFSTRLAMGSAAADLVQAEVARSVIASGSCRIVFGCAPSQDDFFAALLRRALPRRAVWRAVTVFHMDEYVGFDATHAQSFRRYLQEHFLNDIEVHAFHGVQGEAPDIAAEVRRYESLLRAGPIQIVCLGFGENGHLAFNDPPAANFHDTAWVKVVDLADTCRQQQVNDGCFPRLADVPRQAVTITLPVFAQAAMLCGVVPTKRKAQAVRDALLGPIGPHCPASLLRLHSRAHLFLDRDAASLLPRFQNTPAAAGG